MGKQSVQKTKTLNSMELKKLMEMMKKEKSNPVDYARKLEEKIKMIKSFTLMDDVFMSSVFTDKKSAEEMVNDILDRTDIKITYVKTQNWIKNLQGRDVVLDIYAIDSAGKRYNFEVQNYSSGNNPKRARYIASVIDANITDPGVGFENIDESYVIFISDIDVFGMNLPIYHIERVVQETQTMFGDGAHIMFVNASIQDDTKLGRLMHDFHCEDPDDMYSIVLKERVKYFKETNKGVQRMCEKVQKLIDKETEEAVRKVKQEAEEARKSMALELFKLGDSLEKIAKVTKTDIEEVRQWIEEKQN